MSWRVVIITKRCKLEYRLGYLVCRGEELKKIYINEISTLIIESTAVSMTSALLCELIKCKVNIVFCDEKHNPHSQLYALYGRHDCSGKLKLQLSWSEKIKSLVWTEIVRQKILQQYRFVSEIGSEKAELIKNYANEVETDDLKNREGFAAKVYFNALFGMKFKRGDETFLNAALNYGYAILLSAFNREILIDGYNTQLGIAHKNEFNFFNLGCDLMEPFRPLVDRAVFCGEDGNFNADYKHALCDVLNRKVKINGVRTTVNDARDLL